MEERGDWSNLCNAELHISRILYNGQSCVDELGGTRNTHTTRFMRVVLGDVDIADRIILICVVKKQFCAFG